MTGRKMSKQIIIKNKLSISENPEYKELNFVPWSITGSLKVQEKDCTHHMQSLQELLLTAYFGKRKEKELKSTKG